MAITVEAPSAAPQAPPARPALVRRVDIGEPIAAWQGRADTSAALARALEELAGQQPWRLTLVLVLPPAPLGPAGHGLEAVLARATGLARRTVLTRLSGEVADLRGAESPVCGRLVQVEGDVRRAVIGAMLSLEEGDGVAVIGPGGEGRTSATGLMAQGVLWRASLEAPEDGVFHDLPAGEGR